MQRLVRPESYPALPALSRAMPSLLAMVLALRQRQRTRQALALLDGHLLRDIGLTAGAASDEAAKRFWQA